MNLEITIPLFLACLFADAIWAPQPYQFAIGGVLYLFLILPALLLENRQHRARHDAERQQRESERREAVLRATPGRAYEPMSLDEDDWRPTYDGWVPAAVEPVRDMVRGRLSIEIINPGSLTSTQVRTALEHALEGQLIQHGGVRARIAVAYIRGWDSE